MSDQLTIVLTLKDRTAFTHRWLRYMNGISCPYPILIADGGDDADLEAHLRNGANYPQLRYDYVRYPVDGDYRRYYLKLADAIERVTTPYVLLADNDDFFLLDAIPKFVAFLDGHGDHVSCGGQRVVLRLLDRVGALIGSATAPRYEARVDPRPKSIVAHSALARMQYFLANVRRLYLWASWYGVHRTAALVNATGMAGTHSFRDPVAHELHVNLALLLEGNVRQLDAPFFVNQAGSSQFTAALETNGSVAERFATSHALDDVCDSIERFARVLTTTELAELREALRGWLVIQSGPPNAASELRTITLPVVEPYILIA